MFTTRIDVNFGDCDPAGIVYYPTLFHYCHVAFERSWNESLGIPYAELITERKVGFPTVHVETDFTSPARYGDALEFRVSVERIGSSSVTYRIEATIKDRRVLTTRHTKVCLNLGTFEKLPIPEDIRRALERLTDTTN